MDIRTG